MEKNTWKQLPQTITFEGKCEFCLKEKGDRLEYYHHREHKKHRLYYEHCHFFCSEECANIFIIQGNFTC